jgi:hypothetical protein
MDRIYPGEEISITYKNEVGTGTGPTLEFYNLLSQELQKVKFPIGFEKEEVSIWRIDMPNNLLFPRAINPSTVAPEELAKISKCF